MMITHASLLLSLTATSTSLLNCNPSARAETNKKLRLLAVVCSARYRTTSQEYKEGLVKTKTGGN